MEYTVGGAQILMRFQVKAFCGLLSRARGHVLKLMQVFAHLLLIQKSMLFSTRFLSCCTKCKVLYWRAKFSVIVFQVGDCLVIIHIIRSHWFNLIIFIVV